MEIMTSVMCAEGASERSFNALYAGPRAMWADGMATDYAIQKGDLVQFDGGCIYEGYWCDFKRMGAATGAKSWLRTGERGGLYAAIEVMKPGVPFNAPLQAAFAVNDAAGYRNLSQWCLESGWSAIDHNLGLDLHEQPGLSATNTSLL